MLLLFRVIDSKFTFGSVPTTRRKRDALAGVDSVPLKKILANPSSVRGLAPSAYHCRADVAIERRRVVALAT